MKKLLILVLVLALLPLVACEMKEVTTTYNPGDIAVINKIIDKNGLNWEKATPADGSYVPESWAGNLAEEYSAGIDYFGIEWSVDEINKRITTLYISDLGLTGKLDVTGLTALKWFWCDGNQLAEIRVSGLASLKTLFCYGNQLTALDLSGLTALETLSCDDNQLTSLDLSGLTLLTWLDCSGNQLTELNLSGLMALTNLYCSYNQLSWLDVSGLTALKSLHCSNNQLTKLDVSGLTALESLSCFSNQLATLDVSNLTSLDWLLCGFNQLSSLALCPTAPYETISACYNDFTDTSQITGFDPALWDTGEFRYTPQN